MAGKAKSEEQQRRTRMTGYPTWFWEVMTKLKAGEMMIVVPVGAENQAINLRHRWHLFRKDLVLDAHPDSEVAVNTMLGVKQQSGQWCVIFDNISLIGLSLKTEPAEALHSDGSKADELAGTGDDPLIMPQAQPDAAEELVKNWMKGSGGEALKSKLCPPHEWDATGCFCLHCFEPKPDDDVSVQG